MVSAQEYRLVFEALQKRSIEDVVRAACQIMGMPIVVCDAAFIVLAKYPNELLGDEQWDANVPGHQIEPRFMGTFAADNHFAAYRQGGRTVLFNWGHYADAPRISSVIVSGDREIGYFAGLATGVEVEDRHFEAAEILSEACSILMEATQGVIDGRTAEASALLYGLLDGKVSGEVFSADASSCFPSAMHPPYLLLCARPRNPYDAPMEVYLGRRIATYFDSVAYTVFEAGLYVLVGSVDKDYRESKQLHDMAHDMKARGLDCGFSRLFDSPHSLGPQKWQADAALRVGSCMRPGKSTFHFDDCLIDISLDVLAEALPSNVVEHPLIETISAYDARNRTEYLLTLEAFIDSGRDKKATAEVLHIHRNTLLYRLQKLEELFSVNYGDESLLLSFALLDYAKRRDEADRSLGGRLRKACEESTGALRDVIAGKGAV